MAIKYKTRVREVASNKPNAATAFNLPATAATGFRTFVSAYSSTEKLPYHATNGTGWESGIGTFTDDTPDTITRTKILESSNADAAVDFSAGGDVTVFVDWPAKYADLLVNPGVVCVDTDGSTQQSISVATFTKLTSCLAVETTDQNGWWDHANKKFQPDEAGHYYISSAISINALDSNAIFMFMLYKNGAEERMFTRSYGRDTAATFQVSGSAIVYLNGTTDYAEAYVYQGSVASRNTDITIGRTFFIAHRVGD